MTQEGAWWWGEKVHHRVLMEPMERIKGAVPGTTTTTTQTTRLI